VSPQVEGIITEIFVHSGEHVAAGAPLMQIDPAKQQATVRSQEDARAAQVAQLKWAQQNFDRVSGLANAGVVSRQELDQAKSTLDTAQAQLHSLDAQVNEQQVQLHYYRVVAPRAGIVGDVPVRVGDRVVTTTQLTTVDRPGSLEAYIYVPIERSGDLKMNLPVEIVDGSGKSLAESRITFLSPQVDTSTQTVLAKAQIANANDSLRTAQFIRARVVWGTQQKPVVPVVAVSRIGGQYFAFVAEPDQKGGYVVHQKPLQVGQIVGNNYVVLDGVKPGDKVIISGTQFLIDGVPVVPQESTSS
jgi:RND family efflux transporter MFP subunit